MVTTYLLLASLAEKGGCGSFFGQRPKNEPPLLLFASEASKKYPKTGWAK
jgi:hypothetical protein